mmetsp:Transcript_21128/g.39030  ORF Transcript_21128/g.39030 Transcript_21128/m.39030 type:complete len:305 (+) Transcript_21128:440-1354(+)
MNSRVSVLLRKGRSLEEISEKVSFAEEEEVQPEEVDDLRFAFSVFLYEGFVEKYNLATDQTSLVYLNQFEGIDIQVYNLAYTPHQVIIITGAFPRRGRDIGTNALSICATKEYALTTIAKMKFGRRHHSSAYHQGYVYVVGGDLVHSTYGSLSTYCERYNIANDLWEEVAGMPKPARHMGVTTTNSLLITFGGLGPGKRIKSIQCLDMNSLTWRELSLKLPVIGTFIACFKARQDEVFFIQNSTLYSLSQSLDAIHKVKDLSENIDGKGGQCIYHKKVLHCFANLKGGSKHSIGDLDCLGEPFD